VKTEGKQMTKKITRREFIKIIAVTGAAGTALKLGLDAANQPGVVTETRLLMGTVINLTVAGASKEQAEIAIAACLDEMQTLEAVFSRFDKTSQISQLNLAGSLSNPNSLLVEVLLEAQKVSQLTQGAYDITVKPLIDLYQFAAERDQLPDEKAVQETLELVDFRKLTAAEDRIWFEVPGMEITLDGIAKGFIVDRGVAALKDFGYTNVMVEAGGDLMAHGEKALDTPWRVGLQPPRKEITGLFEKVDITNKAVATSGDYMQHYSTDMLHHHILDPRSGHSSKYLASATVVAPNCLTADALATALMVLAPEKGLALVNAWPEVEALLISKDMEESRTGGF
jgi:thiamine biosynthesis lipoprotein